MDCRYFRSEFRFVIDTIIVLTYLKNRLPQWMLIIREWRHIKMTKRAGRGHDPSGIEGTPLGGLSIPCRSCPQPEINLPAGWEDSPPEIKYVALNFYYLLIY